MLELLKKLDEIDNQNVILNEDRGIADYAMTAGAGAIGGKALGKAIGKTIPGVGLALSAQDAYDRFKRGDYSGAGMQALSGLASTVPGIGTATSMALDAATLAKDLSADDDNAQQGQARGQTSGQTSPNAAQTPSSAQTVMSPQQIADLQNKLIAAGAKIKADGIMGPKTKLAMKQFNIYESKMMDDIELMKRFRDIVDESSRMDETNPIAQRFISGGGGIPNVVPQARGMWDTIKKVGSDAYDAITRGGKATVQAAKDNPKTATALATAPIAGYAGYKLGQQSQQPSAQQVSAQGAGGHGGHGGTGSQGKPNQSAASKLTRDEEMEMNVLSVDIEKYLQQNPSDAAAKAALDKYLSVYK